MTPTEETLPTPSLAYSAGATPERPLRELLLLAIPTIAQMASYTVMQFLDTWMLSRLGTTEPTAAGQASLFAWSFIGFGVGVLFCVNTLVSQAFGRKDFRACGPYLWQGIWFAAMFAAIALPAIPFAEPMFRGFKHEPALAAMEAQFFSITVGAAVFKLASVSLGQFLLAVNRPWMVLIAAVTGVAANALVNLFLVFGLLGAPRLGVAGAAIGTVCGTFVEMTCLAAITFRARSRAEFNTLDWRPRRAPLAALLKMGIPSGAQSVADILAWTLFSVWIMAPFGTDAMAANNFMFRYLSVSFMPAFGISTAVTALVGRYVGAGEPDTARRRAHLGFYVAAAYMAGWGVAYVLGRDALMRLFTDDPDVLRVGAVLMVFAGVYQLFDAMYIVYNGALRGAGDTLVPAVATGVLCWTITVGGGYVMAHAFPHWGVAGPWTMATIYGVLLGAFMLARFARGKWRAVRLEGGESSATLRGFDVVPGAVALDAGK